MSLDTAPVAAAVPFQDMMLVDKAAIKEELLPTIQEVRTSPADEFRQGLEELIRQEQELKVANGIAYLAIREEMINQAWVDRVLKQQYPVELELKENETLRLSLTDTVSTQWPQLQMLFEEIGRKVCFRGAVSLHVTSQQLEIAPEGFFENFLLYLGRKVSEIVYCQIGTLSQKADQSLKLLISQCFSLASLDFTDCDSLTADELVAFVKLAKNLKKLNCSGCKSLTNEKVKVMLQCQPKLSSLSFAGCHKLTDEAFNESFGRCDTFERVNLAECQLGDATVEALKSHKFLTHLSLRKCPITDRSVQALANATSRLQVLDLSNTKISLQHLAAMLNRHFYAAVDFRKCGLLPMTELDGLIKSHPFVRKYESNSEAISPIIAHFVYYLRALFEKVDITFAAAREMRVMLQATNRVPPGPALTKEIRDYVSQFSIHLECQTLDHPLVRELAPHVSSASVGQATERFGLIKFLRLSKLSLKGARISDDFFHWVDCPSLLMLTIEGGQGLSTQGFQNLTSQYPKLQELNATKFSTLSYREIADIGLSLNELRHFTFSTPKSENELQALTSAQKIALLHVLSQTRKIQYGTIVERLSREIEITADNFGYLYTAADNTGLQTLIQRLHDWLKTAFSGMLTLECNEDGNLLQIKIVPELLYDTLRRVIQSLARDKSLTLDLQLDKTSAEQHALQTLIQDLPRENIVHIIFSNEKSNPATAVTLFSLVRFYPQLQEFSVSNIALREQDVRTLADTLSNLEGIHLTACTGIVDLCKSTMQFPNLRRLSLKDFPVLTDREIELLAKAFPLLRQFRLVRCNKFPNMIFKSLATAYKDSLELLDLSGCRLPDDSFELKDTFFSSLNSLLLSDTGCTDRCLEAICQRVGMLTRLELNNTKVSLVGLKKALGKGASLQLLQLQGCSEVDNATLSEIAQKCNMLRKVDLQRCEKVDESGVVTLYRSCKPIERVELARCRKITPALVEFFQQNRRNTNVLTLDLSSGLSDLGIEIALRHYFHISSLTLAKANKLTPQLMEKILSFLEVKHLRELVIENCQSDDQAIFAVLVENAPHLRKLSWNGTVTFKGTNELKKYTSLNHLVLKHLPKDGPGAIVTDVALPAFAKEHKSLHHLELDGFGDLEKNALEVTIRLLPKLKTLSISNCQKITGSEIAQLKEGAQHVTITL